MRRPRLEAQQRGRPLAPSFPGEEVTIRDGVRACVVRPNTNSRRLAPRARFQRWMGMDGDGCGQESDERFELVGAGRVCAHPDLT